MSAMKKTNAMRILETLSLPYDVISYDWDEEHLDAVHASEEAGLDPKQVYKTIVMQDNENQAYVFCLPADKTISVKKARQITGSKTLDLIKLERLQPLTGYMRGGCSPLGMKKHFPTYIEQSAKELPFICVSAGQRGLQLKLSPADLIAAAKATYADFS